MFHYDRIEITKAIDVVKSKTSKECEICSHWCFSNLNHLLENSLLDDRGYI